MRTGYQVIEYVEVDDETVGDETGEIIVPAGRYFKRDRPGVRWWDWSGNTKVFGPFYLSFTRWEKWRFPVWPIWTVETEAPWRKGWGLGFSAGRRCLSVGVWKPRGRNRWLDVAPEEIAEW